MAISSILHFKIEHKSLIVTVVIGLLCFSLSNKLRLIPYLFTNIYVVISFSFIVLYKGSYEIIKIHLILIVIYAL